MIPPTQQPTARMMMPMRLRRFCLGLEKLIVAQTLNYQLIAFANIEPDGSENDRAFDDGLKGVMDAGLV